MGKVGLVDAVKTFTLDPAKNYEINRANFEAKASALTGKYKKTLEGDFTLAQATKIASQLKAVIEEFNGQQVTLSDKAKLLNASILGRLTGAVTSVVYKSPLAAAQTVVGDEKKLFDKLLALSNQKKVEAESRKKEIEKAHVTFKAEKSDVDAILDLSKEKLKVNTKTFFSDSENAPTFMVSDKKAENMDSLLRNVNKLENLLLKVEDDPDLEADEVTRFFDLLNDRLTQDAVSLPITLPSCTKLLHFATVEANNICGAALTNQFAAASVVPTLGSFNQVSYQLLNSSIVAQATAEVTFAQKAGDPVFAKGVVVMTSTLFYGECSTAYTVRIVTVNANVDTIDMKKFAGAFSTSSGVGRVESA